MTPENKEKAENVIERMKHGGVTDLWSGITLGLKQFEGGAGPYKKDPNNKESENVKALLLLTDGKPQVRDDPPMGG